MSRAGSPAEPRRPLPAGGNGGALRALLSSAHPEYLLEAHNALSAQLVEEAGFRGIWASSLTLSCSSGVRDNNELCMAQAMEILEFMADRVTIPILFDGDTGYGNFNHFQRLVRKLERRSVAGVCIEDKVFPKVNSFVRPETQALAPVEEFCAKIRAGKDHQSSRDFVIVARTEALVTNRGMSEALDRTHAFAEAGADAVLVHSRASTAVEIRRFMGSWTGSVPVVCVPTTYASTPPQEFEAMGVSLVIWANHMLRAAITGMREAAMALRRGGAAAVESRIAPVQELLDLQDAEGIYAAELQPAR